LKWCNKSIFRGDLIWVKDQNENVRLAREVLLDEGTLKHLRNLEIPYEKGKTIVEVEIMSIDETKKKKHTPEILQILENL